MTLDELQAEVARARRIVSWIMAAARGLGLTSLGAFGTFLAVGGRPADEGAPQHREQPASGPEPQPEPRPQPRTHALECTPAEREQLLEAEQRASRDARAAVDAMHAMRDACRDQRETP
jgi:hypothetical protein